MAETSNPAISGTTTVFSGTTSSTFNSSNFSVWDNGSTNYAVYQALGGSWDEGIAGYGGNNSWQIWDSATQPTSADYGAYQTFYIESNPFGAYVGLMLRCKSVADGSLTGYQARIKQDGTWDIRKWVNGSQTAISNGSISSLTTSAFHTMEFYASGTSDVDLKFYVNGAEVYNGTEVAANSPIIAQDYPVFQIPGVGYMQTAKTELRTEGAAAFTVNDLPASESVANGATPTLDLSNYVSGGTAPYTYAEATGTTDSVTDFGCTLQSDGTISGSATPDGSYAVTFNITDSATGDQDTTEITFIVSSVVNSAPVWVGAPGTGADIPDYNLTEGVAVPNLDISDYWTDTESFTVNDSASPAWPTGVDVVAGEIVVTEGSISAGTHTGLTAEADDGTNAATLSNTFSITIVAASSAGTVTTPALDNGTGSGPVKSESVEWVWMPTDPYDAAGGSSIQRGTGTTDATTGVLTISGSIPTGSGFLIVGDLTWTNWWLGKTTSA